jgi:hypothetical protein
LLANEWNEHLWDEWLRALSANAVCVFRASLTMIAHDAHRPTRCTPTIKAGLDIIKDSVCAGFGCFIDAANPRTASVI